MWGQSGGTKHLSLGRGEAKAPSSPLASSGFLPRGQTKTNKTGIIFSELLLPFGKELIPHSSLPHWDSSGVFKPLCVCCHYMVISLKFWGGRAHPWGSLDPALSSASSSTGSSYGGLAVSTVIWAYPYLRVLKPPTDSAP